MLKLDNIRTNYGNIEALKGISMHIKPDEISAIIGANGAGKSTILNTISGVLHPSSGTIGFMGDMIHNMPPHRIVEMGISQVPEGRRIFPRMTVLENLEMGAYIKTGARGTPLSGGKGQGGKTIKEDMEGIFTYFPVLKERLKQLGGTLSGGEQQILAIARALMAKPKLIMLDEPSLGLAPIMVERIFEIIRKINKDGVTVVIVEQNANVALRLAHTGYVMETGRIALHDKADALIINPHVKEAYLGG
ncbi:MAG: ABC transporter ATP-binding protein [Deltaproteobacteria bacterium GWC2_42_11]|nr:MAG: ABC transporter ATP-binding protein [Deltaproteobacteria bacterium GWC2_42_11]HBO83965.1 ABC transporter ATP-binding protein [Deltaproteobacteria bacterium]